MIVLDTNAISEPHKPAPHPALMRWFDDQHSPTLHLCAPVAMELFYGAQQSLIRHRSEKLLRAARKIIFEDFRDRMLLFETVSASRTGEVRAFRNSIGRPISVQDAMIAAICIVHGATLATRNVRDFDGLDLKLVNPFEAVT